MRGKQEKRVKGQYFTANNPFEHPAFMAWAIECNLPWQTVLEPFAGSNNLIHMLAGMHLCQPPFKGAFKDKAFCNQFAAYDIQPKHKLVQKRDSLKNFPQGFEVCITNPPYLARNSAKRRGLFFPATEFDDLYKLALKKCLEHCRFVAAIIPASFLNSGLFRDRLSAYILLNTPMFDDTQHPVCLALFKPPVAGVKGATGVKGGTGVEDVEIYADKKSIGLLSQLKAKLPQPKKQLDMRFNHPDGGLGLFAIDNTLQPSIRFCAGKLIDPQRICVSSRSITRIAIDCDVPRLVSALNKKLNTFRVETQDVFLTPFKGLRQDNQYRRRLDFALARKLINEVHFSSSS